MATVEQITAIIEAVMRSARGGGNLGGGGRRTKTLDERHFRRMAVFQGDDRSWRDWSFQFRAALRGADRDLLEVLKWVEMAPNDTKADDVETQFLDDYEVERWGAELYDVLCALVGGEALTIVRAESGMNGFMAWKSLYRRYNPITPAKALAVMMEVMNPPKEKEASRVPKAIDEWDMKVAVLQREFNEKLSDRMKTALMLSMCPPDLQDVLYQHAGELKSYEEARDRMKGMINNRIARSMPSPMEIGEVKPQVECEDDVAAVSAYAQSHGCGGWGHLRRECPTVTSGKGTKGKGKGQGANVEYGKGESPSGTKSAGKGGKGDGKSTFKGTAARQPSQTQEARKVPVGAPET